MRAILTCIAILLFSIGALSPVWAAPCPGSGATLDDCCGGGDTKCPMPGMTCAAACAPATLATTARAERPIIEPAQAVSPATALFAGRMVRPPLPPPRAAGNANHVHISGENL